MIRIVRWDQQKGLVYEVDPRHVEIIFEQLNFTHAKIVTIPGTRDEGRTQEDHREQLEDEQVSKYRAPVARCNYSAPDRPDIAYTAKGLARGMALLTKGDWQRFKRLARYLKGQPRMQQMYEWQSSQDTIKIYSGADWAGCRESRKSTTGGCITIGKHMLKGRSKTQSPIALSSGASAVYSTETLGLLAMLKDSGYTLRGEAWSDANIAVGIINGIGFGKTRHIDTNLPWTQQSATQQRLMFNKALGKDNPADLYTKYPDTIIISRHLESINFRGASGRATKAPKLHMLSKTLEPIYHNNQEGAETICTWINTLMITMSVDKARLASMGGRRTDRTDLEYCRVGGLACIVERHHMEQQAIDNSGGRDERERINYRGEQSCRDVGKTRDETSSDQQVLWGTNGR